MSNAFVSLLLEHLGNIDQSKETFVYMKRGIAHPSPLIREGAICGMELMNFHGAECSEEMKEILIKISKEDPSKIIRDCALSIYTTLFCVLASVATILVFLGLVVIYIFAPKEQKWERVAEYFDLIEDSMRRAGLFRRVG